ncbi:hypothetical protein BD770DRAFT_430384 [Pilaira anomala]|nr:hypothetical protein BD770DRAFT_430384 [Pilaira anomala]
MNFAGCEELRAYVRDVKHPSFGEFVDVNSLNIARWSANITLEASDLFSMWRHRYALFLKEYQKTDYIISSKKYDENKWQLIAKMAKTLINKYFPNLVFIQFEASFVIRIEMLEVVIAAAPLSSSILKELLGSQKDEYKQQQGQEEKDFNGRELSDDEENYLQSITNEGTMKSCIQFLAAQRLLLEELDTTDTIIAKLGLSRIVNAINKTIRNLIYSNLNDDEKQVFVMKSAGLPSASLEPDVCTVIDNIIKVVDESGKHKLYSIEDMEQIQTKKAECSKNKQRDA